MTEVQIFKWFCKEQKIMPMIREMYYTIMPSTYHYENGKLVGKKITFDECIRSSIEIDGFYNVFDRLENSYYYTVGWAKNDAFREKHNFNNINRKWHYFVDRNLFFDESSILGKELNFKRSIYTSNGIDESEEKGIVKTIEVNKSYSLMLYNTDTSINRRVYKKQLIDNIQINFYIKRKNKIYHGSNI